VVGREDDVDPFPQDQLAFELGVEGPGLPLVLVSYQDVELVQPQRWCSQLDFSLGAFHPDARVLLGECSDGGSNDPKEGGLERRYTHGPGQPSGGDGGDLGFGSFHPVQQQVGMLDEDVTGVGESDPAADALEQWRPYLAL
jgi:hypothetical protein